MKVMMTKERNQRKWPVGNDLPMNSSAKEGKKKEVEVTGMRRTTI